METAPAKATAAGQLFRATGAGAIEALTRYACSLTHSSDQTILDNTLTYLAWNTETQDDGATHDTATNNSRVTSPVAGWWAFTLTVAWQGVGNSATLRIGLVVNRTTTHFYAERGAVGAGAYVIQSLSGLIKVAASDYVEASVFHVNNGGSLTTNRLEMRLAAVFIG
jgi:hypothetical protein